jgi:tripeptide aminopeptidase
MITPEVRSDRLVELFTTLCRINSPSRQEREVSEYVKGFLRGLGLEVREDHAAQQVEGNANNVIATLPANISGVPRIFFSAHLDTVEPNPNVKIIQENGIIRTDGTSILGADDKAGVSAILEAIRIVVENNLPHGQIQLLLTVCEGDWSQRGAGVGPVAGGERFRLCVRFGSAHRHGYLPDTHARHDGGAPHWQARSRRRGTRKGHQRHRDSRARHCPHATGTHRRGDHREHRLDSRGHATNIVCPEVHLRAEARSRSKAKVDAQVAHMIECFEQAARERGGRAEIRHERHYEGYQLTENDLPVRVVHAAARKIGLEPLMRPTGGGSDANIFIARGLPCCVVGTAMEKVHTHEELVQVENLARSVDLTLAIIREVNQMRP